MRSSNATNACRLSKIPIAALLRLERKAKMPIIKMLETRKGTEDGFTVRQFEENKIYDVRDNLARRFIAADLAIKVINTKEDCNDAVSNNG